MGKMTITDKIKRAPAALKGLVVAGLAAAGFAVYRSRAAGKDDPLPPVPNVIPPKPKQRQQKPSKPKPPAVTRQWIAAAFPLRRGMQGEAVGTLQVVLNKLGAGLQADGKFGQATEAALAKLGLAATVSDAQLRELQARGTRQQEKPGETKYQRLQRLGYNGPTEIEPAIALRKEITAPVASDERIRHYLSGANKTLTNIQRAYRVLYGSDLRNDLLGLTMGRIRFGQLITRLEALSGRGASEGQTVLARVNTLVQDAQGNTVTVKAGTRLGSYQGSSGGVARFADATGSIHQVPQSDIL